MNVDALPHCYLFDRNIWRYTHSAPISQHFRSQGSQPTCEQLKARIAFLAAHRLLAMTRAWTNPAGRFHLQARRSQSVCIRSIDQNVGYGVDGGRVQRLHLHVEQLLAVWLPSNIVDARRCHAEIGGDCLHRLASGVVPANLLGLCRGLAYDQHLDGRVPVGSSTVEEHEGSLGDVCGHAKIMRRHQQGFKHSSRRIGQSRGAKASSVFPSVASDLDGRSVWDCRS
jgi:hypothetical protein